MKANRSKTKDHIIEELKTLRKSVAELKQINEVLLETENRFRTIVEESTDAIISVDSNKKIVTWNEAAETYFGFSASEAIGKPFTFIMPEQNREECISRMRKVTSSGESSVIDKTFEEVGLKKDGSEFPIECSLTRWKTKDGIFLTTVIRDISDRKQAAAALNEKSVYLDNILRGATEHAIATTDLDLRITYYNPMAEKLHGYNAEDVIGKTVMEMHTKEKVAPERFEKAIENVRRHGAHCYTVEKITKEGTQYIDVRVSGIHDIDGELVGFANFARDVTEQRTAEREKKRVNEKLRKSEERYRYLTQRLLKVQDEERERVSRDIHDSLGQYLATLSVHYGLMKKKKDIHQEIIEDFDKINDLIKEAIEECHRLSFELSPPSIRKLGIVKALNEVVQNFRERTSLKMDFEESLIDQKFDHDQELMLFRILQESLSNIIKHAGAKRVNINLFDKDDQVHFHIVDDGKGFNIKDLECDKKDSLRRISGFGLISMRERVENLNGKFEIVSKVGEGTQVKVSIPV